MRVIWLDGPPVDKGLTAMLGLSEVMASEAATLERAAAAGDPAECQAVLYRLDRLVSAAALLLPAPTPRRAEPNRRGER